MNDGVILLVEDSPDDELLTIRALKANHILNPVVVAHDGVEALDYLFSEGAWEGRSLDEEPAIILLDLKLPKLHGLEVLRRIRAHELTRLLRVVILTSSKEEQDLVNSYSLGCNSYIRKPVDFEQFRGTVGQLGLYWLVVNHPPPSGGGSRKSPVNS